MPGAQHFAVREHDLHPAVRGHVLRLREVGHPVVERVPDDAPPAQVGDRDHQLVAARLDRVVEVEPADARLDDGVGELLVDLEHPVHVPQADDHRPVHARRRAAVAVVLARAVRPERDPMLVRDPDDRLDLLDRRRHDDRRRGVVGPRLVLERVAEPAALPRRSGPCRCRSRTEPLDPGGELGLGARAGAGLGRSAGWPCRASDQLAAAASSHRVSPASETRPVEPGTVLLTWPISLRRRPERPGRAGSDRPFRTIALALRGVFGGPSPEIGPRAGRWATPPATGAGCRP